MSMSTLKSVEHGSSHSLLQSLSGQGANVDRAGERVNVKSAARSTAKPVPAVVLIDIGIPGPGAIWRSRFFRRQAKLIVALVCAVVLLLVDPLAEASSVTADLSVSARVVRRCGISPSPPALPNSHSPVSDENGDIGVGKGLIINCDTSSAGTMALSVAANLADNAVIRVMSKEKASFETLKETILAHSGSNAAAKPIDLGLFSTSETKLVLIQSDNRVGGQLATGSGERAVTLLIDF